MSCLAESLDKILIILNTKSLEVGNISITFVQASKQLLFKNSFYDFSSFAMYLEAAVSCIKTFVPNWLKVF